MESESYKEGNELYSSGKAEATSPEYDIIQLSKFYFMDRWVNMASKIGHE